MNTTIKSAEQIIGYRFRDKNLLIQALTHSSYANINNTPSYERLEFLGDGVIGLFIREFMFKKYSKHMEGKLTKMQSALVSEASLAEIMCELELDKFIRTSSESGTRIAPKKSAIADVFEAIVAAIYLDGGFSAAQKFLLRHFKSRVKLAEQGRFMRDYKTELQERAQAAHVSLEYRQISCKGTAHEMVFEMAAYIGGKLVSRGTGRSKKEAEKMAAKDALERSLL